MPPQVEYFGFDLSPKYIEAAKKRFAGRRATFVCEPVNTAVLKQPGHFDIVLALGVIHHLDDNEALQLFALAKTALKPGGKLITLDGVYTDPQSRLARWIISQDRGDNLCVPKQGIILWLLKSSQRFVYRFVMIYCESLILILFWSVLIRCKGNGYGFWSTEFIPLETELIPYSNGINSVLQTLQR